MASDRSRRASPYVSMVAQTSFSAIGGFTESRQGWARRPRRFALGWMASAITSSSRPVRGPGFDSTRALASTSRPSLSTTTSPGSTFAAGAPDEAATEVPAE